MSLEAYRRAPLFLASLIAMSAVGGVATHIFLPAMPIVQKDFMVDTGSIQLSLSLAMIMLGVMPLVYGPLSDKYGRRPVILAGTALFLAGCLVCAFSTSLWQLIIGRMLQTSGAAAGHSLSRTVARDVFGRDGTARALAYLMMAVVVAPMLAPSVGGLLSDAFGWRAVFHFTGLLVFLSLVLFVWALPETHPNRAESGGFQAMFRGTKLVIRMPAFWAYTMQSAMGMSIFYAFLAAAPYLMTDVLGRPARDYGFWFIGLTGAFIVGNFVSARLVGKLGSVRLILFGMFANGLVLLAAAGLYLFLPLTPALLFIPATVSSGILGLILANAQAGAIETHPDAIGAASGMSSFLQLAAAALAAQVVGNLSDGTVWPMIGVMTGTTLLALAFTPLLRRELPVSPGR